MPARSAVDPMEERVRTALTTAGIRFREEGQASQSLDFYLPDFDVYIEVKQFHSDRIAKQMAQVSNVIAVQGRGAIDLLVKLIEGFKHDR